MLALERLRDLAAQGPQHPRGHHDLHLVPFGDQESLERPLDRRDAGRFPTPVVARLASADCAERVDPERVERVARVVGSHPLEPVSHAVADHALLVALDLVDAIHDKEWVVPTQVGAHELGFAALHGLLRAHHEDHGVGDAQIGQRLLLAVEVGVEARRVDRITLLRHSSSGQYTSARSYGRWTSGASLSTTMCAMS